MNLSTLGMMHTLIALIAVGFGVASLWRHGVITWRDPRGRLYVIGTVLTCLTAFAIFRRGGFGIAHGLAVVTLATLALAVLAEQRRLGGLSEYVAVVAYSATLFFHSVPGVVETTTRLPAGAPLFANDQAPGLQMLLGLQFAVFVLGAAVQVLRLRRRAGHVVAG